MRKFTILALFYFLTLSYSYAQNWAPLNSHEKFNYRLTGANIVSAQIKVDSAKLINGDSVFYLNRIARGVQWAYLVNNLPQFLQKQVTIKDNGVYNFTDTLNLALYTLAPLNFSWLYDSTQGITAEVVNIDIESIFGTLDSVRVIKLSSGDTVKLSKSFGIIKYPYKYGVTNSCYTLTGIAGRNLGELLSGFKEAFNWNVGDMFEISWFGEEDGGPFYYAYYKFIVKSTYINGDTMKYGAYIMEIDKISDGGINSSTTTSNYTDTLIFIDSLNHIANNYPNQFCYNSVYNNNQFKNYFKTTVGWSGGVFGGSVNPGGISLVSSDANGGEIIATSTYIPSDDFGETDAAATYQKGLGMTYYLIDQYPAWAESWQLTAYRKGSDTVGTFTPDEQFGISSGSSSSGSSSSGSTSSSSGSSSSNNTAITPPLRATYLVYPNPTQDDITITLDSTLQSSIKLCDMQGKIITEIETQSNTATIDISTLVPGMYMLSVTTSQGTVYKKIIKK